MRESVRQAGKNFERGIRGRMKPDASGKSRKSVKAVFHGAGPNPKSVIHITDPSVLVQEYGRRRGARMAPWKRGSNLYKWVGTRRIGGASITAARRSATRGARHLAASTRTRRGSAAATQARETIAFLISRSISKKGIAPTRPVQKTIDAERGRIGATLQANMNGVVSTLT